jgi:AraC-like DNA-binding protein
MLKYIVDSALILGAITILLLLLFRTKSSRNNIFLALSLFSIWYSLLVNYLNQTQLILKFPHLFRTGNLSAYCILSFLYIYSRNTFYPGVFWRKRDWFLLVPAIFYMIDMIPLFILPAGQKLVIMHHALNNSSFFNQMSEGWLAPRYFHFVFRYVWGLALMTLLIRTIIRNRYLATQDKNSLNRRLFWFIVIMTLLRLPLLFPGLFGALFNLGWLNLNFLSVDLSIVLLASSLFFLATPTILYGFLPKLDFKDSPGAGLPGHPAGELKEVTETDEALQKQYYLNEDELIQYIAKMENYMDEKQPFLNPQYSIHDLSRDIDVPVYQLSPIINQHFNANFSTWINKYRISYFISLSSRPENKALTLDALARESGFSNRTTFTNAFKKVKNQTPGAFLKRPV